MLGKLEAFKLQPRDEFSKTVEESGCFKLKDDGVLHWMSWIPQGMKSMIILVHGLGEHIGRYGDWAQLFNAQKIGVIGFDMRGHGLSSGRRGGALYREYIKDLHRMLTYAHENYPFIPKILYGHSMGGNLVIRYTMDYKPMIAGVISSSPWIRLCKSYSEILGTFTKLGCNLFPFITIPNRLSIYDLTHDKNVIDEYTSDPLVHNRISMRLYSELNESGRYIMQNRHKINTPLLLMHGSSDKIMSFKATSDFVNYTSDSTTFKPWKGAYHELHHESEKMEIFQYIIQWMEQLPSIQQS